MTRVLINPGTLYSVRYRTSKGTRILLSSRITYDRETAERIAKVVRGKVVVYKRVGAR